MCKGAERSLSAACSEGMAHFWLAPLKATDMLASATSIVITPYCIAWTLHNRINRSAIGSVADENCRILPVALALLVRINSTRYPAALLSYDTRSSCSILHDHFASQVLFEALRHGAVPAAADDLMRGS